MYVYAICTMCLVVIWADIGGEGGELVKVYSGGGRSRPDSRQLPDKVTMAKSGPAMPLSPL